MASFHHAAECGPWCCMTSWTPCHTHLSCTWSLVHASVSLGYRPAWLGSLLCLCFWTYPLWHSYFLNIWRYQYLRLSLHCYWLHCRHFRFRFNHRLSFPLEILILRKRIKYWEELSFAVGWLLLRLDLTMQMLWCLHYSIWNRKLETRCLARFREQYLYYFFLPSLYAA